MNRITLIPGDGIGPEICKAMKRVVLFSGADVEFEEVEAGEKAVEKYNTPLPVHVIDSIRKNRVAIKGPVTTPIGKGFRSVNVALRKELDLYANVRPVRSIPGAKSLHPDIDLVIIRENTEDLYAGIEHRIGDFAAESIKLITRPACERISDFAIEYAIDNGYGRVTAVHKANIMKLSDGLFLDVFRERFGHINAGISDITFDDMIVDAAAMNMVIDPVKFGVMVMPNLYGDILSDLGAGLVGGLGMVPAANIGKEYAVFEAVHGSAPQIAGKNIANPSAIILSAVMMLRYLGYEKSASVIERAVENVICKGKTLTSDLGGESSTEEFTDAIIKEMKILMSEI